MRRIIDLEREEIEELLTVITHGNLKRIYKIIRDKMENTMHVTFRHNFHGKEFTDYILIHPMGIYGSICATYRIISLDNGENLSLEMLARRFYEAKGVKEKNTYPFSTKGETA